MIGVCVVWYLCSGGAAGVGRGLADEVGPRARIFQTDLHPPVLLFEIEVVAPSPNSSGPARLASQRPTHVGAAAKDAINEY